MADPLPSIFQSDDAERERVRGAVTLQRRLPIGAELVPGGAHFRVWAPRCQSVEVVFVEQGRSERLTSDGDGYFSGFVEGVESDARYRFRLDRAAALYADPASRFQPQGPFGPSQLVDPGAFRWTDSAWEGVNIRGQIIYEMHIGTLTPEGTWAAATKLLPELAALGVTLLEIMPVSEFPGRFGWGYDGVNLYAPTRLYGEPDEMRRFVDVAHSLGLGVVLDVVYNHLGPDGNFLPRFSEAYLSTRHETEWGAPLNFDGEGAQGVREFIVQNAGYWIDEFHLDGLRIDATQCIFDDSERHILVELSEHARLIAERAGRSIVIVGENEPQRARLLRPEPEGLGLDALWNDDFHHSAMVALTGRREAYYLDHHGSPQELISALRWGFLFQGQRYAWQRKARGSPAFDISPEHFVLFLENHDQIANSAYGERLSTLADPATLRAMTALCLLAPSTPMLFQGQEYGSTRPFLFFADHNEELAANVRRGRTAFLKQFPSIAAATESRPLADPSELRTFESCKLDPAERIRNTMQLALHRDLIGLRANDRVLARQCATEMHGAVLSSAAFCLRFFSEEGDRLLLVNLGRTLHAASLAEPLLAPPEGGAWRVSWSSEDPRYGGSGTPKPDTDDGWHLPARAALLLEPVGTSRKGDEQ